jgi:hypothetical protein
LKDGIGVDWYVEKAWAAFAEEDDPFAEPAEPNGADQEDGEPKPTGPETKNKQVTERPNGQAHDWKPKPAAKKKLTDYFKKHASAPTVDEESKVLNMCREDSNGT